MMYFKRKTCIIGFLCVCALLLRRLRFKNKLTPRFLDYAFIDQMLYNTNSNKRHAYLWIDVVPLMFPT